MCLWASARYLLRAQAASTDASGGDVTAAVIMIAVMDANVRHLDRIAPGRYIHYEDPPPDELRRPVTAVAAAERLRLPRETVRRRLDLLSKAGRCVRRTGGYFVPLEVISNDEHLASAQANLAAIARLRRDIEAVAADCGPWPPMIPDRSRVTARPPLRLINRRVATYTLDVVAPFAELAGGYDEAFVHLAMVEATGRGGTAAVMSTVSAYQLAHSLGLPEESVRRRLKKLASLGLLRTGGDGYSAEPAPEREADLARVALANHVALKRLFGALLSDGVDLTARHP